MSQLYISDNLFDSDNEFEVPTLRIDVQPDFCDIPFVCYGEQKRTFEMNNEGTLHFYTDDYRFNNIFDNPQKILTMAPKNIVEPNFSLYLDTPIAFGMQAIYKKRWLARFMQERGVGVFVDLNVSTKYYKLNLIGVPFGYSSFCTRGYSDRLNQLQFEYNIAKTIAANNRLLFVVYGGGKHVKEFCRKNSCIYITPCVVIKKKLQALKQIENSIAFVEEEYDINNLIEYQTKKLFDGQIENFSNQIE